MEVRTAKTVQASHPNLPDFAPLTTRRRVYSLTPPTTSTGRRLNRIQFHFAKKKKKDPHGLLYPRDQNSGENVGHLDFTQGRLEAANDVDSGY